MSISRIGRLGVAILLAAATAAAAEDGWSEPVNGLRGRLLMHREESFNGTCMVGVHLELEDAGAGSIGGPILFRVRGKDFTFAVSDADGRDVPEPGMKVYSGPGFVVPPELVLPYGGAIRFPVSFRGFGVMPDQAAFFAVPDWKCWSLPRDGKAYFLGGTLEIADGQLPRTERGVVWHGKIELPRVRIPTEPERIDPAALGPLIERLGSELISRDGRASSAARGPLSLIDDPRVVPWYVRAVKDDRSGMKSHALDRLSRFDGDEALEGLKIGMATQAADIGNASRPEVAEQSAAQMRHTAAVALARSPHPKAKALLWTMEGDPATAVRLTVYQTAWRVETDETLAILRRGTEDADECVRTEATRLLALREAGKR